MARMVLHQRQQFGQLSETAWRLGLAQLGCSNPPPARNPAPVVRSMLFPLRGWPW